MIVCSIFLMLCCRHCVILADFRHVQTVRAQLGDSLSLECSIKLSSQYTLFWFKQTPGEAPQNIVFWSGNLNDDIYYNDRFNQRGRYRVKKRMNSFNLSIISLEITDMGTYYCGVMRQRNILFGNGAEICLTSNKTVRRIFQRPVLKSVRYGDSVTVECVVNRAVFGDVHLIYWLHWTVEGTYHSIRNTHGNKITCAEDSQECVYSLQRQNFSSEDYGMYYCAIVSCGEVIFGNGTEFTDQSNHFELDPVVLVLGMTNILLVILLIVCVTKKMRSQWKSKRDVTQKSEETSLTDGPDSVQPHGLNYATVNFVKRKNKHKERAKTSVMDTTYTTVRIQQQ